jgi:glyoxylase-like metal-dependent hydrolase (beta-lactamase superfamily II)
VDLFFPATGPPIADGSDAARQLAGAIDDYLESLAWQSPGASVQGVQYERVGRYIRLHHGVYQIANGGGNCILLIDDCGRGLMFDPGPCDFDKPDRSKLFQDDLVLFEREHGLKTVDMAIITHIHGDHYDMIPQLQLRYPSCRIATSGRVACVVEAPWDYSYPALLPWYNEGFDHVPVDIVLDEDRSYCWHDIGIRTIHLPGHCDRHAGYLLTFNGLRLAITGDTIQTNGEPAGLEFIVANDSVPDSESGILKSYRQLAVEKVDLNLGGHGSYFINCREQYVRSLQRIEHSLPALRQLFRNGDLRTAFRRPSRA